MPPEDTERFGRWLRLPDVYGPELDWHCDGANGVFPIIDGIDLVADLDRRRFFLRQSKTYSAETVAHCLYDLVLPRLLAADGALVLHGGVVDSPKGAVGFFAPSGFGKSTLTGSLHRRGLRLMGDDAIHLRLDRGTCFAARIYPSLRLFPDSLDQVFPNVGKTAMVADYSVKRRVPFAEGPDSAPLLALFRLSDPSDDIRIIQLSPAEACMAVIANSFVLDIDDMAETRVKFDQVTKVVQRTPVHDLCYPRDYAALPEVQAAIFEALGLTPSEESAA